MKDSGMKNRLGLLVLTSIVACLTSVWVEETAQAGDIKKEAAVVKKYPPYPDVWDWVTPYPTRMSSRFAAEIQPNGDVQLSYQLKSRSPKPIEDAFPRGEEHSVLFFSKRSVSPPKDFRASHNKQRVILPNGKIIRSFGGGGGGNCFSEFDRSFMVSDHNEQELTRKRLFYVLDRPETFVPSGMCEGASYDDPPFSYRMPTMLADLIPLQDNTFLVVDYLHGVVIRFDDQWQSKSPLLNRRVFVVDEQDLQAIIRSKKFMRPEGEAEGEGLNRQPVDEEFYQYLLTLKGSN